MSTGNIPGYHRFRQCPAMDLSGILRRASVLICASLVVAGCDTPISSAGANSALPTIVATADATALHAFVATDVPPTPSPVPTLPTSTPVPSPTQIIPTAAPSETPAISTPTPDPARQINGIPFEAIALMPPGTTDHVREIAARGRELGRNPNAFSKLGDSAVLIESNLTRFDNGPVNLGPYSFLEPTIKHFDGSWSRYGAGSRVSLTTIGTFDPMWANPAYCSPGENLLACEIRLNNPAVLLIRLGTNDGSAELYERYMRQIIEYCLEAGVVPILGTKADRFEGDNSINEKTRRLATDYRIPLWDFDVLADTLPNRGLTDDFAHLTVYRNNDYTNPETYTHGYPMSDLSALVVLDIVRPLIEVEP